MGISENFTKYFTGAVDNGGQHAARLESRREDVADDAGGGNAERIDAEDVAFLDRFDQDDLGRAATGHGVGSAVGSAADQVATGASPADDAVAEPERADRQQATHVGIAPALGNE